LRRIWPAYHPEITCCPAEGVNRRHQAVQQLAGILHRYVQGGDYRYHSLLVDGEVGLLQWSAEWQTDGKVVHDGVDTFIVRGGQIVVQTIHYSSYSS
jgi:hypothetical protein